MTSSQFPPTGGLILAGGQSLRMGCNKALLRFDGQLLVDRAASRLFDQVSKLAISTNQPLATGWRCPQLPDLIPNHAGPLSGVQAGLNWSRSQGLEWMVSAAVDTPFFPRDLCTMLQAAVDGDTHLVCASSEQRLHPTFSLWHVSLLEPLRHFLENEGGRRMMEFINSQQHATVEFSVAEADPFFNINTVADLQQATVMLKKMPEPGVR